MIKALKLMLMAAWATGASAEAAKCPPALTPALIDSWGTPVDKLRDQVMFQARNLRMLDRAVPYFIVDIERAEIWYRLSGEKRLSGEALSSGLLTAFGRAYPGASCTEYKFSCDKFVDKERNGALGFVQLMDEDEPASGWSEPSEKLLAPYHPESRGVYLICSYR